MPKIEAKNRISSYGDLLLYGEIGSWEDDLEAESVITQLEELDPKNITVRIHSGGGVIMDGLAIYNRLKQSKAHITVYIEGVAASIASVIAMAGDTIYMPENSWLMIHKPWNLASGTAEDMRKHADVLDGFEDTLINIYQNKTGLDTKTIKNYLENETWLNADDAKKLGFIDEIIEDVKAAASINLNAFNKIPGPLKQLLGVKKMPLPTKKDKEKNQAAAKADAKLETKRVASIREIGAKANMSHDDINSLIGSGASIGDAQSAALDAVAKRDAEFHPRNHIRIGDNLSKQNTIEAYSEALACRHTNIKPSEHAREYMSKSVAAMAREVLENFVGVDTRSMSDHTVLAKAMHTTSDFPALLGGAGERILLESYQAVQPVIKQLARRNTARDFRPLTTLKLGEAPELLKVNESGEFKSGKMAEAQETYSLGTYGRIFGLSRQALINDDLGAFTTMNMQLGRAASEFEGKFLLEKILNNPVMSDTKTLFHTDHSNLGTAGALSKTTLSEARKKMRKQVGLDGKTPIDASPSFLLVPAALETDAEEILATIYPAISDDANPFSGKLNMLVDPRMDAISETAWYLFSDPALLAVLEYAYLDSAEGPQIDIKEGFEVDGVEFKVRFDIGAGIIEHRGAFKNAGA